MTPQNQRFLQLTLSPIEYVELVQGRFWNKKFWERSPTYLISRCPLCEAPYTSKLDPHSLEDWGTSISDSGLSFNLEKWEQVGCAHRFRVQIFVNLEGVLPSEMGDTRLTCTFRL